MVGGILQVVVDLVVYIFRYFHLYLQKSINEKNKEKESSGTTETGSSQNDLQRGDTRN